MVGRGVAAACRLGPSHSTMKHHLANARSKVGATSKAPLVWFLPARLPGPDAEADLSRWIDSMEAERQDAILQLVPLGRSWRR